MGDRKAIGLADHLFRREAGKMVATLTRFFGSAHLELAEDVVQETLLKAMSEWPLKGFPDNPTAWLYSVARNGVVDNLRRDVRGWRLLKENAALLRSEWSLTATVEQELDGSTIGDDQLRMFFACCHPSLPQEQQVALALRTLCGFGVAEIARAFVTNEEVINKRLYRAREAFRKLGSIKVPEGKELNTRLDNVLSAIYLLFTEGYRATKHDDLIREDLIEEALRLCIMLLDHTGTDKPDVHALLALMIFHAARTEGRLDSDGAIVLLRDQDRAKWDQDLIHLGNAHLDRAAAGDEFTAYHLEAGIAGLHANAATYGTTDWKLINELYDRLVVLKPTSIVRLNRAIAMGEWLGPAKALEDLERIEGLDHHHLWHAARGEFLQREGRSEEAREAFKIALDRCGSPAESSLLATKFTELDRNIKASEG